MNKKYGFLFAGATLGLTGTLFLTQAQVGTYAANTLSGIDVLSYTVDLKVPVLPGPAADNKGEPAPGVRFHSQLLVRVTEPRQELVLHADSSTIQELRMRVDEVETASYWEGLDLLHIPLPVAAQPGSEIHLSLDYWVYPLEYEGTGITPQGLILHRNHFGSPVLSTVNFPLYTRSWLPSHDHPSDPATFEIHVDAPAPLVAAGPGRLLDGADYAQGTSIPSEPGRRIFHWGMARAIPTYLAHFSVGQYRVEKHELSHGPELVTYVPEGLDEAGKEMFQLGMQRVKERFPLFVQWFGPYLFEKVAFVHEPHPYSMEYASVITLHDPSYSTHELLHHWFGNAVTYQSWNDVWISEGFTTYFTDIVQQGHPDHLCTPEPSQMKVNRPSSPDPVYGHKSSYCLGSLGLNDLRKRLNRIAEFPEEDADPRSYELVRVAAAQAYQCRQARPSTTIDIVQCWQRGLNAALEQHLGRTLPADAVEQAIREWQEFWVDGPTPSALTTSPDSLPSESSDPAAD